MTQDEIIDMARQAGFVEYELDDGTTNAFDKRYAAFAKLVAAKEREACQKECLEQFDLAMSANEKAKLVRDKNAYFNSALGARFCLLRIQARGEA